MEMLPPAPILTRSRWTSDLLALLKLNAQGMDDSEDFLFSRPWVKWEESQLQLPDSVTASMTVASISPAVPVAVHDHHWDISIGDNSSSMMAELSSRLSLGRDAPALSPSILVVEGNIPSVHSGKGPSSSPEVRTTDLFVYGTVKFHSYLNIAHKRWVRVQKMPSRKFSNEQCGYLVAKLKKPRP